MLPPAAAKEVKFAFQFAHSAPSKRYEAMNVTSKAVSVMDNLPLCIRSMRIGST